MSNKKNKSKNRYYRIKEKFIVGASGGLVAGMIFIGSANTVLAETITRPGYSKVATTTGMHVMRRWNTRQKINSLVNTLGLDPNLVQEELNSGKSVKQILIDNGVDTSGLDKALNGHSRHKSWKKHQIN